MGEYLVEGDMFDLGDSDPDSMTARFCVFHANEVSLRTTASKSGLGEPMVSLSRSSLRKLPSLSSMIAHWLISAGLPAFSLARSTAEATPHQGFIEFGKLYYRSGEELTLASDCLQIGCY